MPQGLVIVPNNHTPCTLRWKAPPQTGLHPSRDPQNIGGWSMARKLKLMPTPVMYGLDTVGEHKKLMMKNL